MSVARLVASGAAMLLRAPGIGDTERQSVRARGVHGVKGSILPSTPTAPALAQHVCGLQCHPNLSPPLNHRGWRASPSRASASKPRPMEAASRPRVTCPAADAVGAE